MPLLRVQEYSTTGIFVNGKPFLMQTEYIVIGLNCSVPAIGTWGITGIDKV